MTRESHWKEFSREEESMRDCPAGCGAQLMEDEADGPCFECDQSGDPPTALWRSLQGGPRGPRRSELAKAYRVGLDGDWRDYYEGPYEDDGPSDYEDAE